MKGLQMAGGANWAGDGRGLQMAGGINLAKTFTGLQLAPVNYADSVTRLPAGRRQRRRDDRERLPPRRRQRRRARATASSSASSTSPSTTTANRSRSSTSSATASTTCRCSRPTCMATNIGFKLGGRHLYTNLIAGYQPGDDAGAGTPNASRAGTKRFGTGAGIGWRFPVERGPLAYAELEADWLEVRPVWNWIDDAPGVTSLRVQAGAAAGAATSCCWPAPASTSRSATGGRDLDLGRGAPRAVEHSGSTTVRIYPGLLLGLQILDRGMSSPCSRSAALQS